MLDMIEVQRLRSPLFRMTVDHPPVSPLLNLPTRRRFVWSQPGVSSTKSTDLVRHTERMGVFPGARCGGGS